jgi:hypothetical protein
MRRRAIACSRASTLPQQTYMNSRLCSKAIQEPARAAPRAEEGSHTEQTHQPDLQNALLRIQRRADPQPQPFSLSISLSSLLRQARCQDAERYGVGGWGSVSLPQFCLDCRPLLVDFVCARVVPGRDASPKRTIRGERQRQRQRQRDRERENERMREREAVNRC